MLFQVERLKLLVVSVHFDLGGWLLFLRDIVKRAQFNCFVFIEEITLSVVGRGIKTIIDDLRVEVGLCSVLHLLIFQLLNECRLKRFINL